MLDGRNAGLFRCRRYLDTATSSLAEGRAGILEILRPASLPRSMRSSTFTRSGELRESLRAAIRILLAPPGQATTHADAKPTNDDGVSVVAVSSSSCGERASRLAFSPEGPPEGHGDASKPFAPLLGPIWQPFETNMAWGAGKPCSL